MSQLRVNPVAGLPPAKRNTKAIWITGAVLRVAGGCAAALKMRPSSPPALSADTKTLAKFTATPEFERMEESQKRGYRSALRTKMKELPQLLNSGAISRAEYDQAYLNAWLARQIDAMDDFYRLPISTREQQWTDRYREKSKAPKQPGAAAAEPPEPAEEVEDAFLHKTLATWDAEERSKWEEFRTVTKRAKARASGKTVSKTTGGPAVAGH